MLATQVQYWNMRENARHNLAMENLSSQQLTETVRHNVIGEKQANRQLNIQQQSVTNSLRALTETSRHNRASENLSWFNSYEAKRHNLAAERNQAMANRVAYLNYNVQRQNAETQRLNANTNRLAVLANRNIGIANAYTNRMNAITNQNLSQSTISLNTAHANKMKHDVIQGYLNTAVNAVIGGSNSAQGWVRTLYPLVQP